jgi:hypothetical protein
MRIDRAAWRTAAFSTAASPSAEGSVISVGAGGSGVGCPMSGSGAGGG